MHELDKYWTLSQMAKSCSTSIQRLKRHIDKLKISMQRKGGAILIDKKHVAALRKSLIE